MNFFPLMKTFLLLATAVGLAANTRAQTNADWFTLDAAGGAQSSASYLVNATVGQAEVHSSVSTSANYQITPGFWALENLGPATALPVLNIVLSGTNVVLSWPSAATGFVLQHADALPALPAAWADTVGAVNDNGFTKTLTLPHQLAARFFRLRRP